MSINQNGDILDFNQGLARVRNNKTLYKRMLQMFLASKEIAAFDEELKAGDYAKAGDTAHAIKGVAGNLGFTRLFDISTQLMTELRTGLYNEPLVQEYYAVLEKTTELVTAFMAEL